MTKLILSILTAIIIILGGWWYVYNGQTKTGNGGGTETVIEKGATLDLSNRGLSKVPEYVFAWAGNKWHNVDMKKTLVKKLSMSMEKAEKTLSKLTPSQKKNLEKSWDIEHAYYSSALEGSRVDRKEFEKLGEKIA